MEQKPRPASPESNYGSDFSLGEEDIVNGLLDAAAAQPSTLAHQLGAAAAAAHRGLPPAAPGFGGSLDGLPVLVAPAGPASRRPPVAPGSLGVVGQTTGELGATTLFSRRPSPFLSLSRPTPT